MVEERNVMRWPAYSSVHDFGRRRWGAAVLLAGMALAGLVLVGLNGCGGGGQGKVNRLAPRSVPFLEGVPVPAGFKIVEKRVESYHSGGKRFARHVYTGSSEPFAVRNFYMEQMPLFGWDHVSDQNVKGRMTIRFEKQYEECTVEIEPGGLFGGSTIQVIVKPFERTPTEPPKRPVP